MKKRMYTAILATLFVASTGYAESTKVNDFPKYYQSIEPIQLKDVMLRYFQSTPTGIVSYGLEDAGKASGHVCPAVLGAFLMTRAGLKALAQHYQAHPNDKIVNSYDPESGLLYRGGIKITMSGKEDSGSAANAIGDVMSYITGAKGTDGFKGGPDFPFANRRNLLHYDESLAFNPKTGIEAIFTSMTASYEKKVGEGDEAKWQPATFADCQGTWGECREITRCDKSVKVSYRFKSPEIIGTDPKAPWVDKIKHILDNADKAIQVEFVDNPKGLCG